MRGAENIEPSPRTISLKVGSTQDAANSGLNGKWGLFLETLAWEGEELDSRKRET